MFSSTARGWGARRRVAQAAALLAVLGSLSWGYREPLRTYGTAAAILNRLGDVTPRSRLDLFRGAAFEEAAVTVPGRGGGTRGRLYLPAGAPRAPGLVLVHGVHRLGIDEPRLVAFSRALAGAGIVILTPELSELADYRIDPRGIVTIQEAAQFLSGQPAVRAGGVGVMGFSFAGGLVVLAAIDGPGGEPIRYVVDVGGHHDLARVSRFFARNEIETASGSMVKMAAHPYGPVVVAFSYAEELFSEEDVPLARDVLRLWLWERRDEARARAKALSPVGRARVEGLFEDRVADILPDLIRLSLSRTAEMAAVSPRGRVHAYPKRAFLLHGAGDNVIPAAETQWMALEMGPAADALISRAVSHVELGDETRAGERFAVVAFMARVLREAEGRGAVLTKSK